MWRIPGKEMTGVTWTVRRAFTGWSSAGGAVEPRRWTLCEAGARGLSRAGCAASLQGMPEGPGHRGVPWKPLCRPSGFLFGLVVLVVCEESAGTSGCAPWWGEGRSRGSHPSLYLFPSVLFFLLRNFTSSLEPQFHHL